MKTTTKIENTKASKIEYVKPQILDLGALAITIGACNSDGNNAVPGGDCDPGGIGETPGACTGTGGIAQGSCVSDGGLVYT